ncbi:MAG: hypothetical protein JXB32_22635 [Deltaproteobacteria bacterium]|nr:hypothetical protein [Deltaproteobacteria bacterium]
MSQPTALSNRSALAALLALAVLPVLAGCGDDGTTLTGDVADEATDDETEVGADADADADADVGPEAEVEAEADVPPDVVPDVPVGPCDGACLAGYRTECTCGVDDPCGWADDGICDTRRCEREFGFAFDDGDDCETRENCGGDCRTGTFNACTCDPRDPCRWEPDGRCDYAECRAAVPDGPIFLDTEDCIGAACDGACRETNHTACTCGVDDPCHWVGDGFCDDTACEALVPGAHFDDSADCGGTPGTLTVAATSVVNELDRNDMYLMGVGLVALGYDWVVRDADVTTAELRDYLQQDLTTLYHTSHGNDGVVVTADGTLGVGDVDLAVRNAIFATCLTLADSWAPAFGAATETVLGYSEVSYDYIDDEVVRLMLGQLGAGDSYILAWYEANVAVDGLDDRWIGYVREGSDIVEYSARSGVAPTPRPLPDGTSWVALADDGRLWASSTLLSDARPFDAAPRLVAAERDAGPLAGALPGGWARLGATTATPDDALATARAFVAESLGGLPADAVLAGTTPVFARREGRAGELVGWTVRWTRELDGVPLRGNGVADHLAVLVGPAGTVAWSSWWPARTDVPASVAGADLLLDAAAALRAAATELSAGVKGELRLRTARPVLGTAGPGRGAAVPAWEYDDGRGTAVVVDALTGRVVR